MKGKDHFIRDGVTEILRDLHATERPPWFDPSVKPEPYQEVLVWVDGHRGPSWQNSHALVAYMNDQGDWREERHFSTEPLVGVMYWQPIVSPELTH